MTPSTDHDPCVCVCVCQVLWEMLTREIPFKGLEGLQVAWLVVEKNEVQNHESLLACHSSQGKPLS